VPADAHADAGTAAGSHWGADGHADGRAARDRNADPDPGTAEPDADG